MENDYIIPACIFENLLDLFEPCECGCRPSLSLTVTGSGCVRYSAWCPLCYRSLKFDPSFFDGTCDFGALAIRWNNPDVFKED